MEPARVPPSRLFVSTIVENKDDFEEKFERSYQALESLTTGLSEKETHDALMRAVLKDKGHEEMSLGLLVVILTEPNNAAKAYRDLTLTSRDGLNLVLVSLSQLVLERYLKFNDVSRSQLLWLLRELIRNGVANVDNLCWNVLRHAAGGDTSPKNIFLIENLLDLFIENRTWLDKLPMLLSAVVYTFLRLIEDHTGPNFATLRQKEVTLVASLVREKFSECLQIGRDFLRLLQIVSRIPEFELLWKDILHNPKSLSPNFTGVQQIMQTRTSRRYLQSRLTPEMEKKIVFFTGNVRFGAHKRYQDWFLRQYLSAPESQSLRIDLIRFIVGVIHPSNELLCSDIIPRWAVIGWLLTTCTSQVVAANAKLALFYDWLFFDPERDNIMNIEPAILVMSNSMRSHHIVSAALLDFMCKIIPNFQPSLTEQVRHGLYNSLRHILKMRVLSSLGPLFESPKLDRELRNRIRSVFKEFCINTLSEGKTEDVLPITRDESTPELTNNIHPNLIDHEPEFSDEDEPRIPDEDEDDIPLGNSIPITKTTTTTVSKSTANVTVIKKTLTNKKKPSKQANISKTKVKVKEKVIEIKNDIFSPKMRIAIDQLSSKADNETKCEAMETLVQCVVDEEDDFESHVICQLGQCLSNALYRQFEDRVFPAQVNDETLEDSIGKPLFVLFRNISQLPENDKRRRPLFAILVEIKVLHPRLGYMLLYFLIVCKLNEEKASVYQNLCQELDKSVKECLLDDLTLCAEDDLSLFTWLIPGIYEQFPNVTTDNAQLIQLITLESNIGLLQDLISNVLLGRLVMFTEVALLQLIRESLTWESLQQVLLWQLLTAHGFSLPDVLPLLPELSYTKHPEALTPITLMLKQERPTAEIMKHLLSRSVRDPHDKFVVSILKHWSCEHKDKFAELIGSLLNSRYPNSSPNKRKRGKGSSTSSGPPSADQVLGHLDNLRQTCKAASDLHFYSLEPIQRALQIAQTNSSDSQRQSFSDLFALAEVEDTKKHGRAGQKIGKSRSSKPKASLKELSDSSENSSDEEEIVKPKQAKKRKKIMGSDSE